MSEKYVRSIKKLMKILNSKKYLFEMLDLD